MASIGLVELLTADALSVVLGLFGGPQWGIFLDGAPVIEADATISFDYKQDWEVSDYQQEQSAFATYNKVQRPFDVRVRLSQGGSVIDRQTFVNEVLAASNSLDLYDVVTPERTFTSCNIDHIDWHRSADHGVTLITADLWMLQVRVTASATFGPTAQPGGADPVSGGNVQTQTPSARVMQDFSQFQ